MTDFFPAMQPDLYAKEIGTKIYKDVKMNFDTLEPVIERGDPVWCEGTEAIKGWIARAVKTEKGRHEIYNPNYGSEIPSLIGRGFSADVTHAEARRMIEEALMQNSYILSVQDIKARSDGDSLFISCVVNTIYGEVAIDV